MFIQKTVPFRRSRRRTNIKVRRTGEERAINGAMKVELSHIEAGRTTFVSQMDIANPFRDQAGRWSATCGAPLFDQDFS